MRLRDVILRDTRANQPAASDVDVGTLYGVTDEGDILERSSGSAWEAFSPTGSGSGTVTNTGTLTDHALIVGNAGVDVTVVASLGTSTTLLHGAAAGDPTWATVVEADITLANNATNDVSITKHGFAPLAPNDATKYLDGTGAYSVPAGGTTLYTFTAPVDGSFAWINQGGASTVDNTSSLFLSAPGAATPQARIRKLAMGVHTSATIAFMPLVFHTLTANNQGGFVFRESGTGKIATFFILQSSTGPVLYVQKWSDPNAGSITTDVGPVYPALGGVIWLRGAFSGANIVYSVSADGLNFLPLLTIAKTTQFTTAPDEFGFFIATGSATYDLGMSVYSWSVA